MRELATAQRDARRSRDEWAQRFDEHGVWWTPVNSAADLRSDPQAIAAGAFVDVPTAGGEDGAALGSVATPVDFGTSTAPPAVGDDTEAVLREIGIGADELGRPHDAGIVRGPATVSSGAGA